MCCPVVNSAAKAHELRRSRLREGGIAINRGSLDRVVRGAAILLLLSPGVFTRLGQQAWLDSIATTLVVMFIIWSVARSHPSLAPLDYAALAILVVVFSAWFTLSPGRGLQPLLPVAGVVAAYFWVRFSRTDPLEWSATALWSGGIYGLATVASLIGVLAGRWEALWTITGTVTFDWSLIGRAQGLSVHPNVAAMTLLPLFGAALNTPDLAPVARRTQLVLTSLIALGVVATGSRGGLLGLAVGFAVWVAVRRQAVLTLARRKITAWGVILALGGLGAVLAVAPSFLVRGFGRGGAWSSAVRLIESQPFGVGPGTAGYSLPAYATDTINFGALVHAHNAYLQALAELGVPGVSAIVILMVLVVRFTRGTIRWGALAGLAGLAAHAVFDVPQLYVGVMASIGLTLGLSYDPDQSRTLSRRPSWLIATTIAVVAGLVLMSASITDVIGGRAASAADTGNQISAAEKLQQLSNAPLTNPAYSLMASVVCERSHACSSTPSLARAKRELAGDWLVWLISAQIEAARGRSDVAKAHFAKSLERGAATNPVGLLAGIPFLDDESARTEALVQALAEFPQLGPSGWWKQVGMDEEAVTGLVQRAARENRACELLLAYGEAGSVPPGGPTPLAMLCSQQHNRGEVSDAIAFSALFYSALLLGDNSTAVLVARRVEKFRDNPLARRVTGIARFLDGDAAEATRDLAASAVLGDVESVNLLFSFGLVQDSEATIRLGWLNVSRTGPVSANAYTSVPTHLNTWMASTLRSPVLRAGPLLEGSWMAAVASPVKEFLSLAEEYS